MRATQLVGPILAIALALTVGTAASAQPPRGYWVQSYGTFDRFPYPPAVGGHSEYWQGRPWVTLRDPLGWEASMPLRPKSLYYDIPFATPGGLYRPRHIVVIPDDRPRPASRWDSRPR